ncbi:9316_t:CDS:1, partial [Paraglomus occultum]
MYTVPYPVQVQTVSPLVIKTFVSVRRMSVHSKLYHFYLFCECWTD